MKHLYALIISMIICTLSACGDKEPLSNEEAIIQEPIVIETGSFSGITANQVTLLATVKSLNKETILDAGFMVTTVEANGKKSAEKNYSIGKNVQIGETSLLLKPTEKFEQRINYNYYFYIKTNNAFYKGPERSFTLNNIAFDSQPKKYAYGKETITVTGNFEGLDSDYRLKASGAFELFDIPYVKSEDKKSLHFEIGPSLNLNRGTEIEISLVRKGENPNVYQQKVLAIEFLPKLDPLAKKRYYPSDIILMSSTNLGRLHENDSRIKILINDLVLPFSSFIILSDHKTLKGTSFRIGYCNAKDTVYFKEPLELVPVAEMDANMAQTTLHPSGEFSLESRNMAWFFPDMEITLGGKPITGGYDYRTYLLSMAASQVPTGEQELVIKSRFYTYKYPQKIKVQELAWTTLDRSGGFWGETVTAQGNFISGKPYIVFDQDGKSIGDGIAQNNELKFQITNWFDQVKAIKLGYPKSYNEYVIIDKTLNFTSKGFTFDNFYPKRGMSGDILTIEGKGIAYASKFMLGDQDLRPVIINNNKVTFSIPRINGTGKVRINYYMNEKLYQSDDYFELY